MRILKHNNLEFAEVFLSELDEEMRCDAEYFLGSGLINKPFRKAKDSIIFSQYGTSKELNEEGLGYPILRLNEFDDIFLGSPAKYCNHISNSTYNSLKIKNKDILICRTNGNPKYVGKSAIAMQDKEFAFASYLFRVRADENFISPETLTVYLKTKYGRGEIERFSMISNQANFSPAKFRKIKIPIIPKAIQEKIQDLIEEAHKQKIQSEKLYSEAEQILLSELGLENWKPKTKKFNLQGVEFEIEDTINNINTAEIFKTDRYDAEYWNPKFDNFTQTLLNQKNIKFSPLGSLVSWKKGIEIGSDEYLEEGDFPFIRVSNITKNGFDFISAKYVKPETYEKLESFHVKKGEILFSKDGTAGISYLIREDLNGINSGGILRLNNYSEIPNEYIEFVLNSPIIQIQIERKMSGALIQHLKVTEAMKFIIPEIPSLNQVAKKVNTSYRKIKKSKDLLDLSVRAVEIFIEENEEEAIEFIEKKKVRNE